MQTIEARIDSHIKAAEPPHRLAYIDGLRAIAVLGVIIYHTTVCAGVGNADVLRISQLGRSGVDLFLVLSGFCLSRPLINTATNRFKSLALARYAQRRFFRIYPPYLAALCLSLGLTFLIWQCGGPSWLTETQKVFPFTAHSLADVGTHLLLIHGLFNDFAHSIDGVYWSLSLEWQFYFALPLLVLIGTRRSIGFVVGLTFAITLLDRIFFKLVSPDLFYSYVGNEWCAARLAEFGAGIWCAQLIARNNKPVARRFVFLMLPLLILAFSTELSGRGYFWLPILYGCGYSALVVSAVQWTSIRSCLEKSWLVYLGKCSYSLYLTHVTVLILMGVLCTVFSAPASVRIPLIVLGGPPLAISLGIAFHYLFERPFMYLGSSTKPEKVTL